MSRRDTNSIQREIWKCYHQNICMFHIIESWIGYELLTMEYSTMQKFNCCILCKLMLLVFTHIRRILIKLIFLGFWTLTTCWVLYLSLSMYNYKPTAVDDFNVVILPGIQNYNISSSLEKRYVFLQRMDFTLTKLVFAMSKPMGGSFIITIGGIEFGVNVNFNLRHPPIIRTFTTGMCACMCSLHFNNEYAISSTHKFISIRLSPQNTYRQHSTSLVTSWKFHSS